jgi:hypothetical protein
MTRVGSQRHSKKNCCLHLAITALLATGGSRKIVCLNYRICHWRLCVLWMMNLRVWSVMLSNFGISTVQIDDRTRGQVLWPPGLPDLQLAVEPSEERNLLDNVLRRCRHTARASRF